PSPAPAANFPAPAGDRPPSGPSPAPAANLPTPAGDRAPSGPGHAPATNFPSSSGDRPSSGPAPAPAANFPSPSDDRAPSGSAPAATFPSGPSPAANSPSPSGGTRTVAAAGSPSSGPAAPSGPPSGYGSPSTPQEQDDLGSARTMFAGPLPDRRAPSGEVAAGPAARLVMLGPDGQPVGERVLAAGETLDVGRDSGPPWEDDAYLDRVHARLTIVNDGIRVEDHDSLNGIFLKLQHKAEIRHGDQFRVGQELL